MEVDNYYCPHLFGRSTRFVSGIMATGLIETKVPPPELPEPCITQKPLNSELRGIALKAGFENLNSSPDCHSLLKKHLTPNVLEKLKDRKTSKGATLLDVVRSGFANLDSQIGIYAPDTEAYTTFAELFDPIINEYHGNFGPPDFHPKVDFGDVHCFVNLDPCGKYIVSTRIRCGRSLHGFPLNPNMNQFQYTQLERQVTSTLKTLKGDLSGTYYPLSGMTTDIQENLVNAHYLFKNDDRFLEAANATRYWPCGRGLFMNADSTFLVWVNEEDHVRAISMQPGGDLGTIYRRLVRGITHLDAKLPFNHDERLGYLTFCPTNLGTTIRASVHIRLPKLGADRSRLENVAAKFNLQVRGASGEHTESIGGIYDISNKRRLGITEYESVREMQDGILALIQIEKALQ